MKTFRWLAVALFFGAVTAGAWAADKLQTFSGKFEGIEQGDYFHWNMTDKSGEPRSFFILRPDPTVEAVVDAPEKFVGKKCTVKWKTSQEEIPEAGGKIEVDQVVSVVWE